MGAERPERSVWADGALTLSGLCVFLARSRPTVRTIARGWEERYDGTTRLYPVSRAVEYLESLPAEPPEAARAQIRRAAAARERRRELRAG